MPTISFDVSAEEFRKATFEKIRLKKTWRELMLDKLNVESTKRTVGRPTLDNLYTSTPWGKKELKNIKETKKDLKDESRLIVEDHSKR